MRHENPTRPTLPMIVIDGEFSGLDTNKHSLLSIGAVDFDHPTNTFYGECRLPDGAAYDPDALKVNGFTVAQITDPAKPSVGELVKQFHTWAMKIEKKDLAGECPHWDERFLNIAYERNGIPWPFGYRLIDLHSVAFLHMTRHHTRITSEHGLLNLSLKTILPYVGIPDTRTTHHALEDAKLEAEAFARLLHGTNLLQEYARYPVPAHLTQAL